MFAIATPTTVTLTTPGDDGPSTLINFRTNDADTSRCVMEIVTPEGDTHRLTFNVRGGLVDTQFIPLREDASQDAVDRPLSASDYMVDGVDIRSFNPYTHQPQQTVDSAYQAPAATRPQSAAEREMAQQHRAEASDRAKEALDAHLAKSRESGKERAEREQAEADERRQKAVESITGNTPVAASMTDHAKGLNDPFIKTEGVQYHDDGSVVGSEGRRMDGSTQTNPDGEPMAPAPSSPLPGSPPPHPLGQSDPGKVNTSQSMAPA